MSYDLSVPVTLNVVDGYAGYTAWDGYTAATSLTSNPIDLTYFNAYSLTFSCPATGSPVGSVFLQASADGVNFTNVGSSQPIAAATNAYFESGATGAKAIRVLYNRTSGSITVTAKCTIK